MGTSHRRRGLTRARARNRVNRARFDVDSVTTAQFLDLAAAIYPDQPTCHGPVLVHEDGSFECHGPRCPGGMRAHHPPDVVHPCEDHPELTTYVECRHCARPAHDLAVA